MFFTIAKCLLQIKHSIKDRLTKNMSMIRVYIYIYISCGRWIKMHIKSKYMHIKSKYMHEMENLNIIENLETYNI